MVLGGRYELAEQVGNGGYCEVWRATDTVLSRLVAGQAAASGLCQEGRGPGPVPGRSAARRSPATLRPPPAGPSAGRHGARRAHLSGPGQPDRVRPQLARDQGAVIQVIEPGTRDGRAGQDRGHPGHQPGRAAIGHRKQRQPQRQRQHKRQRHDRAGRHSQTRTRSRPRKRKREWQKQRERQRQRRGAQRSNPLTTVTAEAPPCRHLQSLTRPGTIKDLDGKPPGGREPENTSPDPRPTGGCRSSRQG